MRIVPCDRKMAKRFIAKHHRHNIPAMICIFTVGLAEDGPELVGVAMAGLPVARKLMDGYTLEVTRVCVLEDKRNANSMLYGACARAAKALGYRRVITYTLASESGASLRGAGWITDGEPHGHSVGLWLSRNSNRSLFGQDHLPSGPKIKWQKELGA